MTAVAVTLVCPSCGFVLTDEALEPTISCRRCNSRIEVSIFPAVARAAENHAHQVVVAEEASCYFHLDRVADFACSRCGRFLCPLCRIPWVGEDICPLCLETASTGAEGDKLASSRFHFDGLALLLSTAPLPTIFFSMFTAPVALGFALFTFRKNCSIVSRSKVRFILAILFSTATIVGWIVFFVYAFRHRGLSTPD